MALDLTIVTPQGEAFAGVVENVVLPGAEGEFGVLEQHERFLAPLRVGVAKIVSDGETTLAAVSAGFAEVSAAKTVVLADTCELAGDIDVGRAERAKQAAEATLRELTGSVEDERKRVGVAEALARAETRLIAAGR
ncbi:MAG: ATP synthase F1 subunit epsilon [Proteobacteria bacterium]|nr:ATP synthase F1 subunit epsilon [Pseudomonadota bacterium]